MRYLKQGSKEEQNAWEEEKEIDSVSLFPSACLNVGSQKPRSVSQRWTGIWMKGLCGEKRAGPRRSRL